MFQPKNTKFKKYQRRTKKNFSPIFRQSLPGNFSIIATTPGHLRSKEFEVFQKIAIKKLKKSINLRFSIFPQHTVSKRSPNTTLGGSKGATDYFVARVVPGAVICNVQPTQTDPTFLRTALSEIKKAASKLSVTTIIIYSL
jgi:large subunit ribosomal protein L16